MNAEQAEAAATEALPDMTPSEEYPEVFTKGQELLPTYVEANRKSIERNKCSLDFIPTTKRKPKGAKDSDFPPVIFDIDYAKATVQELLVFVGDENAKTILQARLRQLCNGWDELTTQEGKVPFNFDVFAKKVVDFVAVREKLSEVAVVWEKEFKKMFSMMEKLGDDPDLTDIHVMNEFKKVQAQVKVVGALKAKMEGLKRKTKAAKAAKAAASATTEADDDDDNND